MPVFKVTFLMEGISDLCPLKIAREGSSSRSKRAFKCCNVWLNTIIFIIVYRLFDSS
ncbi:hypothetical protein R3W88_017314 [Solanum pinnatisectum]|uniref:Uncharacterized protein n=1 Tax=Solanum pinnatisectum TaxID=50273 RepID=A0AAV9KZW1_9SOLN|nr:hypothetical protein R3W88_017314 [Solanum pinnatisectum]